jgi:hypothetical protein
MAVVPTTARASYDKLTIANDALIPKLNCQVFARFPPLVVFWQQGRFRHSRYCSMARPTTAELYQFLNFNGAC